MTCHVFKGAGSENQNERVQCRQVDVERKPVVGRRKLCHGNISEDGIDWG